MTELQGGPIPPQPLAQNVWVRRLVPLGSSLALHLILIGMALAVYQGAHELKRMVLEEDQLIVPDATLVKDAAEGGVPNPGLGGDPNRPAASDLSPDTVANTNFSPATSIKANQTLMGTSTHGDADSMIGLGAATSFGGNKNAGNGQGGEGALPFGVPGGGGGEGPRSPFMGIAGNAKRVAYVCDASGSMLNRMPALKNELKRAVDILQPIQAFNVIFFQETKVLTVSQGQLLMANPVNKSKAYDFLGDVSSEGGTDPMPALTLAFRQHPQLVYLLTDGDFQDNNQVIKKIRELNRDKHVKINTIAFISSSDEDAVKGFIAVLKQIAAENGGQFKLVLEENVN